MYWVELFGGIVIAYLAGSVNTAIIVSNISTGQDIRSMGNKNPGTANIGRTLGRGWAAMVFFGDVGKAIMPMIVAERLFFSVGTTPGILALSLMGMAAVTGHIKPLYFSFKGGGGLATTLGVLGFFIPVELFISMLVGFALGMVFFKSKKFKLGRWIAMFIILLNPAVCLLTTVFLDVPIAGRIKLGGHEWSMVVAVTALVVYIVLINIKTVIHPSREKP